jgi:hypothetical protein
MPIKPPARCWHSEQPVDTRISSTRAPANHDVADATRPGSRLHGMSPTGAVIAITGSAPPCF